MHWGSFHLPPPLFVMRMVLITTYLDKGQVVQLRIAEGGLNLLRRRNSQLNEMTVQAGRDQAPPHICELSGISQLLPVRRLVVT